MSSTESAQKVAFFDLDGTFFRWQLYHELVFELKNQGVFNQETALRLDEVFTDWQAKRCTWRDYELEVVTALERSLPLIETSLFDEAASAVVSRSGHKIYNYTKRLLDTMKAEGYYTLAISGSQQEIAEIFAQQYGFDLCIGALYERSEGHFTGNYTRYVPGRKHDIINEFLVDHPEITLTDSIAIGDSEGDINMLTMVSKPIAFNPSSGLFDEAIKNDWEIVIERKNMAYTIRKGDNGSHILAHTDSF